MATKTHVRKNYKNCKHTRKNVKMQKGGVDMSGSQKQRQEQHAAHQKYLLEIVPIQSALTGDAKEIFENMTQHNTIYNYQSAQNINQIQLKSNVSADHIVALKQLYDADKIINEQSKTGFAKWFRGNTNIVKNARKDKKKALEQLFTFIDKK
jgi:hypothetical protein